MCGIAGILGPGSSSARRDELETMCATLAHRGPDDAGYYVDENVALGMRRLSIIDPDGGHQPVHNEVDSVWAVVNGEIYNYGPLRRQLEMRGHAFHTASDSEVLVHLYEEFGDGCVSRLRGMFAFALWDRRRRRLLLGRDRLGIKPLFYTQSEGRLLFASELKALLSLPSVERRLNWTSVNHFLAGLATPNSESIVSGVHKLPEAHVLGANAGAPARVSRYWDVDFTPDRERTEAEFAARLRELLEESVSMHMVSDVPVGAFLSGGLDSSAVVAMMARSRARPIKTFSIGFGEAAYDESGYARQVARQIGTEHHELRLEPDVFEVLEHIAWDLDEPFGDSSALPTYMVSRLAAGEVKVVLSGDGGDELFAGYDRYRVEARERRYDRLPAAVRRAIGRLGDARAEGAFARNFMRHLALTGATRYLDASTLFGAAQRRRLLRPEVAALSGANGFPADMRRFREDYARGHWLSALQRLDLNGYLPLDILVKVDRMSMANSLEARVPMLDHKLVEFAASIPPEWQLQRGNSKRIFKRAMRGVLPDEIIDRRKQGFGVPLDAWFRGKLTDSVHEILLSQTCRQRGIFDADYVRDLLRLHEGGRNMAAQLWSLMSFELWCRTFLDGSPARTRPSRPAVRAGNAAAAG